MTLPIDLVFVRHGEAEGNLATRYSEKGDHEVYGAVHRDRHTRSFRLSERGRGQAKRTGAWLKDEFPVFDRHIVSEYIRAMETATLLDLPDANWQSNFMLTERDWGELDNYSEEERQAKFSDVLRMHDIEPFYWRPPNGESLAQMCLRADRILHTLHRECSDKTVVMVCHGEMMWGYRVLIERMSQQRFKELHLSDDPYDRLYNGQVIHYTRRNPETRRIEKYANWMRMIRPASDPVWESGWQEIVRPTYSNDDLQRIVDGYPAVIER